MPPEATPPAWLSLFAERYGDLLWAALLDAGGESRSPSDRRAPQAVLRSLRSVCKELEHGVNRVVSEISLNAKDMEAWTAAGLLAKFSALTSICFTVRPPPVEDDGSLRCCEMASEDLEAVLRQAAQHSLSLQRLTVSCPNQHFTNGGVITLQAPTSLRGLMLFQSSLQHLAIGSRFCIGSAALEALCSMTGLRSLELTGFELKDETGQPAPGADDDPISAFSRLCSLTRLTWTTTDLYYYYTPNPPALTPPAPLEYLSHISSLRSLTLGSYWSFADITAEQLEEMPAVEELHLRGCDDEGRPVKLQAYMDGDDGVSDAPGTFCFPSDWRMPQLKALRVQSLWSGNKEAVTRPFFQALVSLKTLELTIRCDGYYGNPNDNGLRAITCLAPTLNHLTLVDCAASGWTSAPVDNGLVTLLLTQLTNLVSLSITSSLGDVYDRPIRHYDRPIRHYSPDGGRPRLDEAPALSASGFAVLPHVGCCLQHLELIDQMFVSPAAVLAFCLLSRTMRKLVMRHCGGRKHNGAEKQALTTLKELAAGAGRSHVLDVNITELAQIYCY